tara:strand:- start:63492 stop:64709 length:1218 start_codon:yes stop_codon:yes gene_type:complete
MRFLNKYYSVILLLTFFSLTSACNENNFAQFKIENTSAFDTEYASVFIPFTSKEFPEFFKLVDEDENEIPYQLDDLDRNGIPEQVFLQLSVPANSYKILSVIKTDKAPSYESKTNITIKVRDQKDLENMQVSDDFKSVNSYSEKFDYKQDNGLIFLEGPGWESNLVGYRLYFDDRNRIDIFGKSTEDLSLNNITETYHERRNWGADVLKVSSSLGIGTPSLLSDGTFYTIEKTGIKSLEVISDGPLRSILNINYPDWEVDNQVSDINIQLEIHANHRYTELRLSSDLDQATYATGLVTHPNISEIKRMNNELYSYGYTWGDQTDLNEGLGMAVIIPNKYSPNYEGVFQESYVYSLKDQNSSISYRFLAAWELEPEDIQLKSEQEFQNYIDQVANQWQMPLKVTKE